MKRSLILFLSIITIFISLLQLQQGGSSAIIRQMPKDLFFSNLLLTPRVAQIQSENHASNTGKR